MKSATSYRPLISLGLFLLSGVSFAFALPPKDVSIFGWVAFLPFLIAARISRTVLSGLGGVLTAILATWVLAGPFDTSVQCANSFMILVGLALLFAPVAAFASFTSRRLPPFVWAFGVSCAAVATELIINSVCPVSAALSQHSVPAALHLAAFTGTWGISFLLWFLPGLVITAALGGVSRRIAIGALAGVILLLFVLNFTGSQKVHGSRVISVAAVQAPTSSSAALETRKLAGKVDVAVWPEHLLGEKDPNPYIAAESCHIYVVADVPELNEHGNSYNTAVLISPTGERVGAVRKKHLFGKEILTYNSGESHPIKCGDFIAGIAICYDTAYNDVVRRLVREGAEVMFVPTGDPQVANGLFNHLHGAMMAFRSAENGVPLVWADENGLSTIFDERGISIVHAPARGIATVYTKVGLRDHKITFFTRAGDYFAYFCIVGVMIIFGMSIVPKSGSRKKSASHDSSGNHSSIS